MGVPRGNKFLVLNLKRVFFFRNVRKQKVSVNGNLKSEKFCQNLFAVLLRSIRMSYKMMDYCKRSFKY